MDEPANLPAPVAEALAIVPSMVNLPLVTVEEQAMVANAEAAARDLTIPSTDAEALEAKALMKDLGDFRDHLEERRVAIKAPFLAAGRQVDTAFHIAVPALAAAVNTVKNKLAIYLARMAAEKARADAEAAKAAAAGEVPPITPAVVASRVSQVKIQTREHTEILITDLSAIPREFMFPNMRAIEAAYAEGRAVPGTERKISRVVINA
jgi:hypothetical protein